MQHDLHATDQNNRLPIPSYYSLSELNYLLYLFASFLIVESCDICSLIQSYVFFIPFFKGIDGSQSRYFLINVFSLFRPRTPFGASRSYFLLSLKPAISSTISTSWLIETISLLPRLRGSSMLLYIIS